MVQFSNQIIDKFIAPGASLLKAAEIPDMTSTAPESSHWVANFFLNSALSATWKPPTNAYVYNYLRRAAAAFREHANARHETLEFIRLQSQSATRYTTALFHWENFLGQSWHAYALLKGAFGGPEKIYEKGKNTVEERLNLLYNQMKHVESRIENDQILNGATVPVWLTKDGLQSVDTTLSYEETGEVLKDLAQWADILQDPHSAQEKLKGDDVTGSAPKTE